MIRKLLPLLLLIASTAYGVETLTINSKTRDVINLGAVNYATGQLKVNGIAVVGGGGGGGGGGTGTIDNVRLILPTALFVSPVDYTISGGLAEGTATLAAQDSGTVFANLTGGSAAPIFVTIAALKTSLSLGNVDNTSDANKPISTATQAALDTLTTAVADNTADIATNTTDIATKASTSAVTSALALKADTTYVDSSIANFTGTTNLVTLGTVTTGVWSGTALVAGKVPTLNNITAPTGNVSLNSHKITLLDDPTGATDAANKQYVDSVSSTGPPHPATSVASTANLTLSGEQTIDGVLTSASRILVKNQTSSQNDGIYVTASGAWSRATDADADAEISGSVFVSGGTVNAGTTWGLTTPQPITLGTDPLAYTQTGANTIYSASGGVQLIGSQFSLSDLSAAGKLLGRYSSGAGSPQEITISTGLTLDGSGNLTSSAGLSSFTTGNLSPLFSASLGGSPTTAPALAFTLSNAAGNTFFGNGTSLSAAPTFMDAATARTAMGGTTAGKSLFTLSNPSVISFPRINSDNTVTARTPTETRTDIGAGTVNVVQTTNNVSSLLGISVASATTNPTVIFDPVAAAANTFYGNGTGSSATPTFMSASTARGSLGGTTVGQNLFTLANPSAITYPRISATNTVTAATGATVLADIGGASTTDPRFSANVTGIRKSAGGGATDTAATASTDYVIDTTQIGTNATNTWTTGFTNFIEGTALQTTSKQRTLPPTSAYTDGTIIKYSDTLTQAAVGPLFLPAGADTLKGIASGSWGTGYAPFISAGLGGKSKSISFQKRSTDWRIYTLGGETLFGTGFRDPLAPLREVDVDVSNQVDNAGWLLKLRGNANMGAVVDAPVIAHNVVTGYSLDGNNVIQEPLYYTDILNNQDHITQTSGTFVATTDGTRDEIWLDANLTGALTVTLPPVSAYSAGEVITFYDALGSLNDLRTVTIQGAGSDTVNAASNVIVKTPYQALTFRANPGNSPAPSNWSFNPVAATSGIIIPGTWATLQDGTTVDWDITGEPTVTKHNAVLTLTGTYNPTRVINPIGMRDGEEFQLKVIHSAAGSDTLTIANGSTMTHGNGLLTLTSRVSDAYGPGVDLIEFTYQQSIGKFLVKAPTLDITPATVVACSNSTGASSITGGIGNGAFNTPQTAYRATKRTFTDSSICRLDFQLKKTGTIPTNSTMTAYLYSDAGTGVPVNRIATSNQVTVDATNTGITTSYSTVTFNFNTPVTSPGTCWMVLQYIPASGNLNGSNLMSVQSTVNSGLVHQFTAAVSTGGLPGTWNDVSGNGNSYFNYAAFH